MPYGIGAALILPSVMSHPFQPDFYGPLTGGIEGAHKLKLETTYWGYSFDQRVCGYINQHAPKDGILWVTPFSEKVVKHLQIQGMLRKDLQTDPSRKPDFVVIHSRLASFKEFERNVVNDLSPIKTYGYKDVPFIRLFDLRRTNVDAETTKPSGP